MLDINVNHLIKLNQIKENNKIFQVFMENRKRLIFEVKQITDGKEYYDYPKLSDLKNIINKYFMIADTVNSNEEEANFNSKPRKGRIPLLSSKQKAYIASTLIVVQLAVIFFLMVQTANQIPPQLTNVASTAQLIETIDFDYVTKADVLRAIEENQNITEYKDIIIDFVHDVDRVRPHHNWWVFYQNVKRMTFSTFTPEESPWTGEFSLTTSDISYRNNLSEGRRIRTIRHELIHALHLIIIEIDGTIIRRGFSDQETNYGASVLEALTSLFNYYSGNIRDGRFNTERLFFKPIFDNFDKAELFDVLFDGNIDDFIELVRPYANKIEEFISYIDAHTAVPNAHNAKLGDDFLNRMYEKIITIGLEQITNELNAGMIDDYELWMAVTSFQAQLAKYHPLVESKSDLFFKYIMETLGEEKFEKMRLERSIFYLYISVDDNDINATLERCCFLGMSSTPVLANESNHEDYEIIIENGYLLRLINRHATEPIDLISGKPISEDADIIGSVSLTDYILFLKKNNRLIEIPVFGESQRRFYRGEVFAHVIVYGMLSDNNYFKSL